MTRKSRNGVIPKRATGVVPVADQLLSHAALDHSNGELRELNNYSLTHPANFKTPNETERERRRLLRVCMPAYTEYELDSRVRRYAESLAKRGDWVDIFCLRRKGQKKYEVISGVHVHRLQHRIRNEKRSVDYLLKTVSFFLRSTLAISREHLREPYDLAHVHNMPDFLVFSALLPRIMGAGVILDIHDLVPELLSTRFDKSKNSLLLRAAFALESWSTRFAHSVIVANDLWAEKLVRRCVRDDKCSVFLNYPDPTIFCEGAIEEKRGDDRKILVYPGTLSHHQGLDIAIAAFDIVAREVPDAEFHIYGSGPELRALIRQVRQLGLQRKVLFKNEVPTDQLPPILAGATCGVIPKRASGFGNEAFSTKSLEFMTMGLPVIVSRTEIDRFYFDDSLVLFFESENCVDLADKMRSLIRDKELRVNMAKRAKAFAKNYSWGLQKARYLDLVDRLGRSIWDCSPNTAVAK